MARTLTTRSPQTKIFRTIYFKVTTFRQSVNLFPEEEYFWGQDMELSPMVWIIIVSSVVCFWILLAAFLACFCGPNFLECYLCEQQVPRGQWTRVDHRETCAKDHERFLNGLQRVSLRCPRCLAR